MYILETICKDNAPGKKMVQKMLYLVERKGLDLGMDYSIHFYGPYSSDLDQYLHMLEANGKLEIDTSSMTHTIKFLDEADSNPLTEEENSIFTSVVSEFRKKTPLELEVLTTTDFVADRLIEKDQLTESNILEKVKKIKGTKFSDKQIKESIQVLNNVGLLDIAMS